MNVEIKEYQIPQRYKREISYDYKGIPLDEVWSASNVSEDDELGSRLINVLDIHSVDGFIPRVFFTTTYIYPDGERYSNGRLHVRSLSTVMKYLTQPNKE